MTAVGAGAARAMLFSVGSVKQCGPRRTHSWRWDTVQLTRQGWDTLFCSCRSRQSKRRPAKARLWRRRLRHLANTKWPAAACFVKSTPRRNLNTLNRRTLTPTNSVLELILTPSFCHRPCMGGQRWHWCHPPPSLYPAAQLHCPEHTRVQRARSSDETGICVLLLWDCRRTTVLAGTAGWSTPTPSHNLCAALPTRCGCPMRMQSGPAVCPRWCSSWKIPHGAGQGSQETTAAGEQQPLSPALCGLAAPHASSAATAELQLQVGTLRRMQQRSPGRETDVGMAVQRHLMDTAIPPN